MIRPMKPQDIESVISVHQKAFHDFFLTRMGRGFLRGYYQAVLDYSDSVAIVSTSEDTLKTVNGFAVGFREPHRFYALFAGRRMRLLPAIMLAIVRDPGLIVQIIRNIRRVEGQQFETESHSVELSSIAVAERGGGVGGQLLEAFTHASVQTGSKRIQLTTDRDNNDDVRKFYERRGFTIEDFERRGDRWLVCYTRTVG